MPTNKRMKTIKMEDGVGDGHEKEEKEEEAANEPQQQQQQQQQHPSQSRRVDEAGLAVLQMRSHIETQAAAFQGMEQARVMGQELLQAKVQVAELKAEIRIKDAALEAKDVLLQSKDAVIEATRALLQAKDTEIHRLHAVAGGRDSEAVAGDGNWHAHAEAVAATAAAVSVPAVSVAPVCSTHAQRFAAATKELEDAVRLGDLPSRAALAAILIHGREGVAKDTKRAFKLVEEGALLGCPHCQGVLAWCYGGICGYSKDEVRCVALAHESAAKSSKYGQYVLVFLHRLGVEGFAQDYAAALVHYRLAAVQGFDWAQNDLGGMYHVGYGVAQDYAEALRWYELAAAQGYVYALSNVGNFYEHGYSVAADRAEAIRWYKRAATAGFSKAADKLKRLGA